MAGREARNRKPEGGWVAGGRGGWEREPTRGAKTLNPGAKRIAKMRPTPAVAALVAALLPCVLSDGGEWH